MFKGCYTALITPFTWNSLNLEFHRGLKKLVEFQVSQGVSGILATGTTSESPTLTWKEHNKVVSLISESVNGRCQVIAGTGSNSTDETLKATDQAIKAGVQNVLLVDPYYNGPSSLEIRREYIAPVARFFPEVQIIPYIIPGRTGTQLLAEDLAILHHEYPNVRAVKEATGKNALENVARIRKLCGEDFDILSGDDDKIFDMMTDSNIKGSGVISVVSNVAPKAVQEMTDSLLAGNIKEAKRIRKALQPLFDMVTVKTMEQTPYGDYVTCKARNPLPIKTLMNILGMPAGSCRPPLGKMTPNGLNKVLNVARTVYQNNPEIFKPIERFFLVDIAGRLEDKRTWQDLCYKETYGWCKP